MSLIKIYLLETILSIYRTINTLNMTLPGSPTAVLKKTNTRVAPLYGRGLLQFFNLLGYYYGAHMLPNKCGGDWETGGSPVKTFWPPISHPKIR